MAPTEKGTFGLFVPLITVVLLPKVVMKEPAKNKLFAEAFVVIDRTSDPAPDRPPNGGADHEFAEVSHTATAFPGDENEPPAHTFLLDASQKRARTSPSGPPLPSALTFPDEGVYAATLLTEEPLNDEP